MRKVREADCKALSSHARPTPASRASRRCMVRSCSKHGDHAAFTPVGELSLGHFAPCLSSAKRVLATVKRLAKFVVRVRVLKTSMAHKVARDGGKRAATGTRTCTGVATHLGKDYITVLVPAHGVRDDVEALHTRAEFFLDSEVSPDVVAVQGLSLRPHHLHHTAQLICRTCPEVRQRFRLNDSCNAETAALRETVDLDQLKDAEGDMAVLISHPHGLAKRVTFGSWCRAEVPKGKDGELVETVTMDSSWTAESNSVCESTGTPLITPLSSRSYFAASSFSSLLQPLVSTSPSSPSLHSSARETLSSDSFSSAASSPSVSPLKHHQYSTAREADGTWTRQPSLPALHGSSASERGGEKRGASSVAASGGVEPRSVSPQAAMGKECGQDICDSVLSLCSSLATGLGSLAVRCLGLPRRGTPAAARVYHDAPSCPGSSGGAVILVGRRVWSKLQESLQSLPVFLHIGTVADRRQGVALPLVDAGTVSWSMPCRSCFL